VSDFRNILVLQTAFIGDVILSTNFVRSLKEVFPDAAIDILLIPETAILYRDNPYIRQILVFDKRKIGRRIPSFFCTIRTIKKNQYDLGISIQTSLTSALLMKWGGVPERLGFPRQKLLTQTINLTRGLPVVKRTLELLKPFSEGPFDIQTELFWGDVEEAFANDALKDFPSGKPVVGIAPGSVWATKRYPKAYFSELLKKLDEAEIPVVLIGGPGDAPLCQEIIDSAGTGARNLAGSLSLLASAALIERLRLLVTNDSAPLHLANAVRTDVLAIFGPTVKKHGFFPYRENDRILERELSCRPCGKHGSRHCPEKHFRCMLDITPGEVFEALMLYIRKDKHDTE
jgi:heptosyltransferase-2